MQENEFAKANEEIFVLNLVQMTLFSYTNTIRKQID